MEEGDRRDTVRNSVSNPDCLFYHMLQSHIYLSDSEESRHCRHSDSVSGPELEDYVSNPAQYRRVNLRPKTT